MQEIWKDVEGYENRYQVSTHGSVRSLDRITKWERLDGVKGSTYYKGKIIKPKINKKGYVKIRIGERANARQYRVSRLVAITYIDNPNKYLEVNHIDGNKNNNCVENLEWCTHKQNIQHALRTKLINKAYMNTDQLKEIKKTWHEEGVKLVNQYDSHNGVTCKDLALKYDTSLSYMRKIVNGFRYDEEYNWDYL